MGNPSSPCFRMNAFCASVKRDAFMSSTPPSLGIGSGKLYLKTIQFAGGRAVPVCGGEIITTPKEMIERLNADVYEFVQPDASVMGGISAVMDVFAAAGKKGVDVVVHAWGGAAAIMASYHAAFAGGGKLVEYPMLAFPLGTEMIGDQGRIEGGRLLRPTAPGIGITLTSEMEARYPFDEQAVNSCVLHDWGPPPDSYWTRP